MDPASVQQSQHFGKDQGGGDGADERRANRLAGQQRDSALVERPLGKQPSISSRLFRRIVLSAVVAPDLRRALLARQGMQKQRTKILVAAAKTCLDHKIKT